MVFYYMLWSDFVLLHNFLLSCWVYQCMVNEVEYVCKGRRMVKSETRRDAEILVRNPSPRLFGKKFRDSKKVKTNHAKTRLQDLSKTLPRFQDPAKIFQATHVFRGTIRHP